MHADFSFVISNMQLIVLSTFVHSVQRYSRFFLKHEVLMANSGEEGWSTNQTGFAHIGHGSAIRHHLPRHP
jgi:hypothetical protein